MLCAFLCFVVCVVCGDFHHRGGFVCLFCCILNKDAGCVCVCVLRRSVQMIDVAHWERGYDVVISSDLVDVE